MNILVINAGSSSIKFKVIAMPDKTVICSGKVERIGSDLAILIFNHKRATLRKHEVPKTHKDALQRISDILLDPREGVIKTHGNIDAVGHRVVHSGALSIGTSTITKDIKKRIEDFSPLAPLHNPNNLEGILMAEQLFPMAMQVAVFDTTFHRTIPLKARKYAIPNEFYTKYGIQVYGFHGISHKYVSEKAIAHLQLKKSKVVSVHLGNGCSMTAVVNGKSVDHSLGFTPSNGLIMGSRSGDIDHSIIFHLVHTLGYASEEVKRLLNQESGMFGLTGFRDLRDIEACARKGNKACLLALEMNAYRIKKYIGAYTAVMNGLDAIVFTAGVGENSTVLRKLVCTDMEHLGLHLNPESNEIQSDCLREINSSTSKVKILVIPTNEELEIAHQVFKLLGT